LATIDDYVDAVEVRRRFPNLTKATYEAEYLYNRGQLDSAQRQIEHASAACASASPSATARHPRVMPPLIERRMFTAPGI
jgi:hypothetical protein